mmetsp:Transcript_20508/g.48654  ORF Transcript_20508/g.48654 Transcript_20508/m.48654 type:complete len:240 (-) Transcript_20508:67-786(-)
MADLEEATTIILKMNRKVTYQEFVDALGHYLGDPWRSKPYDLIHLVSPCAVVVNFTSAEVCQRSFRALQILAGVNGILVKEVRHARHQGLAANLALYLARRSFRRSVRKGGEPHVFFGGAKLALTTARKKFVPDEMLRRYQVALEVHGLEADVPPDDEVPFGHMLSISTMATMAQGQEDLEGLALEEEEILQSGGNPPPEACQLAAPSREDTKVADASDSEGLLPIRMLCHNGVVIWQL